VNPNNQQETANRVRALMKKATRKETSGDPEKARVLYQEAEDLAVADPALHSLAQEISQILLALDVGPEPEESPEERSPEEDGVEQAQAEPARPEAGQPFSTLEPEAAVNRERADQNHHTFRGLGVLFFVIVGIVIVGAMLQQLSKGRSTGSIYVTPERTLIFGPTSGTTAWTNWVFSYPAGVSLKDFILEVDIENPTADGGEWSYAIDFRETHTDYAYYLFFASDGTWELDLDDGGNWATVNGGDIYVAFDASAGGRNHILLSSLNQVASLYLNGGFVGYLDLSANSYSGDIAIVAAKAVDGKPVPVDYQVPFWNFTVWRP
jgi:hypothetical protein